MSLRHWCSLASVSAVLLAPTAASASPLFELTGAAAGNGGLNARVAGSGAAATYFNPALLANTEQGFELSLLILSDHIGISVDGRTSGDVPDSIGSRDQVNGAGTPISNLTVPTRWLQRGCPPDECKGGGFAARPRQAAGSSGNTRAYQVLGLVNHVVKDRLVLGFHAIVPLGSFTTASAFYNDEREQFFTNSLHPELYSDRLTATSLAFGLGGKILDNLSAGLSFTLNLRNEAGAPTYVRDANNYDSLLLATDVKVHASVSPHFGAAWSPLDWLHLAGTVHSEQKFQIDTTFSALLPSGIETKTSRHEVHDFVPWTFGFGGGVDVYKTPNDTVELVTHGTYALWSYYLDRHGESPGSYGKYLMWKNTLSGAVGARWDHDATRLFFDVSWVPSPVPLQIGRSNYVDNDRAGLAGGVDHKFQLFGLNLRAGVMGQAHVLFRRYQPKTDYLLQDEVPDDTRTQTGQPLPGRAGLQTNNPGWPGFSSQGVVLGGSATLALLYLRTETATMSRQPIRRIASLFLVILAAGCTAEAPEETNLAHNKLVTPTNGGAGGAGGGAGGTSTTGGAGGAGGSATGGAGTGGTSSGGTSAMPSSVGNVCKTDADCTGYAKPSCLTELKPLKGKIIDPMNPTASKFENDLVMPYPNGYCTNTIANSCVTDADCGVGAGCFRGLAGVDKAQLQSLDDMRTCDVSMTGAKNPGGQPDGTTCKMDTECLNGWCKTFLPFSTVQFADVGLCLHPCTSNSDCRQSEGYVCDIPMASLITIINPAATKKYCVGPFTFSLN